MAYTREKLSTDGKGFEGIKSGTENNTRGTTRVEVGEPKGNQARQMRAVDGSEERSTNRNPLNGSNPTKDKSPYEKGETKNTFHPKHGR